MNDQGKTKAEEEKFDSAGEASARTDVSAPTSDDELHDALEDTFPASDPINFAGSTAGRSAENAENPPIGTHPQAGASDEKSDKTGANKN